MLCVVLCGDVYMFKQQYQMPKFMNLFLPVLELVGQSADVADKGEKINGPGWEV